MAGEKGTSYATGLLQAIFTATFSGAAVVNLLANSATSPLTSLYVSLHTADPTAGGNQTSSEISYTGYARVAVARTTGGFTVSGNSVSPAANVVFPTGTGGTGTATYFGIGTASSGTGQLLYAGPISPNIVCGNGVTPTLTTATAVTES